MKHRSTIKDIAKDLGISVSTVSRALRNHYGINKDTCKRIQKHAKKIGYRPNVAAVNLRSNRTNNIGVIIPTLIHNFFSTVISGIEEVAAKRGYNVILCHSNEDYKKEIKIVQSLLQANVDGVIFSISKTTEDFSHFDELQEMEIPIVMFDRINSAINCDKVIVDDCKAAYDSTQHLVNIGKKKIAIFHSSEKLLISQNRINGYVDCLKDNSIKIDKTLMIESDSKYSDTLTNAYLHFEKLLEDNNVPDAVFCANDLTAAGVLRSANEHGIKIPSELAVCGFGDSLVSKLTNPLLTSICQSGEKMGKYAATVLIDRLEKVNEDKPKIKLLKTQLIIRDSTVIQN